MRGARLRPPFAPLAGLAACLAVPLLAAPAPASADQAITIQADVFVVTAGDPAWYPDERVHSLLAAVSDWWSRETSRPITFAGRVIQHQASPESCALAPTFAAALDAFGAGWSDYAAARDLVVVYDAATCDIDPGAEGDTWTHTVQPSLGHGGVITLAASSGFSVETEALVLAHEIGHTFGLAHSHQVTCPVTQRLRLTWDERDRTGCRTVTRGDTWSLMGSPASLDASHLNGAQLAALGLLAPGAGSVQLQGSGAWTVTLSAAPSATRVALVEAPSPAAASAVGAETLAGSVYAVEFRPGDPAAPSAVAGVYLTLSAAAGQPETVLLQPAGLRYTPIPLPAGQTFTSQTGQITVTVLSETATSAVVRITRTDQPALSGSAALLTSAAAWSVQTAWSAAPDSVAYQWLRDADPIAGATAATYTPGADDAGHLISVAVTASAPGLAATTVTADGAWFQNRPATLAPAVIPADGRTAATLSVVLRDGLGRPVSGQPGAIAVSADLDGAPIPVGPVAEDPAQPGLYTLAVTAPAPGRLIVTVAALGFTAVTTATAVEPDPSPLGALQLFFTRLATLLRALAATLGGLGG
jgi:YD repeat-containing protein